MSEIAITPDTFDFRRAARSQGLLREFNDAGVLAAADVHVAARLAQIAGEADESVVLAAALAVRAPRIGHVHVDLATIRETAVVDADEPVDLSTLPWPSPEAWLQRITASTLTTTGDNIAPFRLLGSWLYLDRYWGEEQQVAGDLRSLSGRQPDDVRMDTLRDGLARLFPAKEDARQRLAAASAVLRGLTVVAGGPGTGKTTTVARIVALLAEQSAAAGAPPPLVALAAPTGKAAARLQEAVHEEALKLPVDAPIRDHLLALQSSTLHRLLGWRPDSQSRFRHNRHQRLPHDVVIVDETSMVSLSMMARILEAARLDARLILVGDPGQLVSIEAGAVLGDIVGPAPDGLVMSSSARDLLTAATGDEVIADDPPVGVTIGDGTVVLNRVHRFGGGIAKLAEAIRTGDADGAIALLSDPPSDITWIPANASDPDAEPTLAPVRDLAVGAARTVIAAARAGQAPEAIEALSAFRILCAHRRGPDGVTNWTAQIEHWLSQEIDDFTPTDRWYVGRPLLVTDNDYELRLYNGDTGVVVQSDPDRVVATFERSGEILAFSPSRLSSVQTVYAMTIHKGQGSQFDVAAVLLPTASSRILTRELLYTAATRAQRRLLVVGTESALRLAVARPISRASGLRKVLWAGSSASAT